MKGITPMMESMLRGLAHYKYLTVSHILVLGISKSKDKSRKYFRELMKIGLVNRRIHSAVSENAKKKGFLQVNRSEFLWYLTYKGANFLASQTELELKEIRFLKRTRTERLQNDYFHRVSTIFIHISFEKWVEKKGGYDTRFLVYYDNKKEVKKGKFDAETRLSLGAENHFTPDAICSYTDSKGRPHAFCIEVFNNDKIVYVKKQLEKLFWILDNTKLIEQRIGVDVIPRILVIFDNESLMNRVRDYVSNAPIFQVEGVEELVLFGLDTNIWLDFGMLR